MSRFTATLVFAVMIFGADEPPIVQTHTGTQADPFTVFNAPTLVLAWDKHPAILSAAHAKWVGPATGEQYFTASDIITEGMTQKVLMYSIVSTLPDGAYQFQARVRNETGTWSAWTPVIWVKKDWAPPAAPGGCTVLFR